VLRRLARIALVALVTFAALEVAARAAWRWLPVGDGGGWQAAGARRDAIARGDPSADQAARALTRDALPHPFLGYVQVPGRRDDAWLARHRLPVDELGFIDDGDPLPRRSPDTVIVGVTGGSVAFYFSIEGAAALEREMRRIPELAHKRFEIRRLALGGWKQPQQLFAVQYLLALGGELDVLIELDGYNEIAIYPTELAATGQPEAFPRAWAELVGNDFSPRRRATLGALAAAGERRAGWARALGTPPLGRSALATSLWWLGDRRLERSAADALEEFRRVAGEELEVPGPRRRFASDDEMIAALADLWARSSRLLAGLAAAEGIRYFQFLQPSQYVAGSKAMSDAERRVAIDDAPAGRYVAAGLPVFAKRGHELRAHGVAFTDLTLVFRDVPEPLYVDTCCHVSARGNELLGEAIGRAIAAGWDEAR